MLTGMELSVFYSSINIMKKYLTGFLLIAALAVVGGLKLINEKNVSAESIPCGGPGSNFAVGDCYLGMRCTNTGQPTGGVWVLSSACGAITTNPGSGVISGITSTRPVLTWTVSPNAATYNVQISNRADFSTIVNQKNDIVGNSYNLGLEQSNGLAANTKYYFRVQAANQFGVSAWSSTFTFTTGAQSTGASPSVITPATGFTSDSIFSLLISNGASWMNASGSKVYPKQVTPKMGYYDENNTQVFLSSADVTKVGDLIRSLTGGSSSGPSATLPACGSGNYNTTSGGFTCCTSGWVWMYTGSASVCSGAAVAGSSSGSTPSISLPACGSSNYNTTSGGFTCCTSGWVWLYTGSASVCSGASVVVGSGPVPSLALPACGAGNVTQNVGGFKCCKSSNTTYSWYTGWTGTDAQCAAITVGGGASNSVSSSQ